MMNKKVHVANLSPRISESDLQPLFSSAGSVRPVKIVEDRQTGQARGFAFVEMSTRWEVRRGVSMLNRRNFNGCSLLVKEVRAGRAFRGRREWFDKAPRS